MRRLLPLFALVPLALVSTNSPAAEKEARVYEMRVYYAPEGKLEALNARFKNHTLKLFEKHGLTNVGYFTPLDNKENKLVYFISFPSKEARNKSFKEFGADPEWQKAFKESEKDGKLTTKIESRFLTETEYSPVLKIGKSKEDRVFELRTYTATKGNLGNLNDRFKNHTIKLFEKHGMTNVVYWNVLKGEKGADETLVYLLAHKSKDAAGKSFDAFRKDPDWLAAREASEKKGGGSLTEPKGGVVSEFLVPTDYSPLK
ncbi:MAG TPA: NIPSNAP family protein [Gemmata sp.]